MKKLALALACCLSCAAPALAYENAAAGYAVRDGNAFYKMEGSNFFCFAPEDFSERAGGSVHSVAVFSAAEASQILGVAYSDAYFADEFAKLALLERAELDLRTLPSPLLAQNFLRSTPLLHNGLGEKAADIESHAHTLKIGKKNFISQTYFFRQNSAMPQLLAVDVSFLAANEKLYALTTVTTDGDYYEESKQKNNRLRPRAQASKSALLTEARGEPFSTLRYRDVPLAKRDEYRAQHEKFLRGVKIFTPVDEDAKKIFYFSDAEQGIILPRDWLRAELKFKEDNLQGSLTLAAPAQNMQKLWQRLNKAELPAALAKEQDQAAPAADKNERDNKNINEDENNTLAQLAGVAEIASAEKESAALLAECGALLAKLQWRTRERDYREFFQQVVADSAFTESILAEGLRKIQASPDKFFALSSYEYKFSATEEAAQFATDAKLVLNEKNNFDADLRIALTRATGSAFLFAHREDFALSEEFSRSVRAWQF